MNKNWLREGLKRSGKTQRGLAKALGIDPSNASRLVSGKRRLKIEEIDIVLDYFGSGPDAIDMRAEGMAEDAPFIWSDFGRRERDLEVGTWHEYGERGAIPGKAVGAGRVTYRILNVAGFVPCFIPHLIKRG